MAAILEVRDDWRPPPVIRYPFKPLGATAGSAAAGSGRGRGGGGGGGGGGESGGGSMAREDGKGAKISAVELSALATASTQMCAMIEVSL
jgi:hypothetical protein